MFMEGYFYWCGVVFNVIQIFWAIVGVYLFVKNRRIEKKTREKRARQKRPKRMILGHF